jgi:hypothetical protein
MTVFIHYTLVIWYDVNKYTIIGFDTVGNLLEIMYNIIDSESINIFHAMKCRKSIMSQLKSKGEGMYGAND